MVAVLADLHCFLMSDVLLPRREGVAIGVDPARSLVMKRGEILGGQGLSLTMRDARVLAECLNGANDFYAAGHAYARAHDAYFKACVTTGDWMFEMFFAVGPEADAKRARALPKIAADPTRVPDHGASGPDLPYDESVRRRFFGED